MQSSVKRIVIDIGKLVAVSTRKIEQELELEKHLELGDGLEYILIKRIAKTLDRNSVSPASNEEYAAYIARLLTIVLYTVWLDEYYKHSMSKWLPPTPLDKGKEVIEDQLANYGISGSALPKMLSSIFTDFTSDSFGEIVGARSWNIVNFVVTEEDLMFIIGPDYRVNFFMNNFYNHDKHSVEINCVEDKAISMNVDQTDNTTLVKIPSSALVGKKMVLVKE